MAYTVKAELPCTYCDTPTCRRNSHTRVPMCWDCGHKRMIDGVMDIHMQRGDAYDKWLKGMERYIRREFQAIVDSDGA